MEWISTYGGTATAGPNFSYVLATRALKRADQLDLSRLRVALNGAEPIDPDQVEAFVEAGARQPGRLDGGYQPAGGGRQQRDVVAGPHAPRLQRRGIALGLLVELAPGDDVFLATDDERDGGVARRGALDAGQE
jgi:hypothetical protein